MFVADAMLKKLARWLRILGAEAIYPEDESDNAILALAKEKNAVLLTQDVELSERAKKGKLRVFLVPRDITTLQQIALLVKEFELNVEDFPSKTLCPKCNGRLAVAGRKDVEGKVPEGILKRFEAYWLCGSCGKAYWEGSHWLKIKKEVEELGKLISP